MLRDGRKLIGVLRSVDQFANLVLEHTVERIFVGEQYGDVTLGLYIVRGENVVLVGELVRIYTYTHTLSLSLFLTCRVLYAYLSPSVYVRVESAQTEMHE